MLVRTYLEEADHVVVVGIAKNSASLVKLIAVRFTVLDRTEQISLSFCGEWYR